MVMMEEALPYVGMVLSQFAQVGLMIIGKEAMSSGMTNFTFVSYSNFLAAIILLPSFFFLRSTRPPLTLSIVCGFFLLGVLGCTAQLTGYQGINYTNASFASAMLNLIPGFTFVLAIILRMEKFDYTSMSSLAKVIGTIVSIAGAFVVTIYKGPQILGLSISSKSNYLFLLKQQSNWIIGGLFLTVDCIAASAFLVVQAFILQNYPAEMIIVFFYCFFAAILSAVISLTVDNDLGAWALQPNKRLFAVLYSGIFGSAFQVCINTWCVRRRGPLFVAMFHPLGIVIAAGLGIIFLGDILFLGSLVGPIIIVIGFYSVMWGKAKEMEALENIIGRTVSTHEKAPLIQIMEGET